jgi:hypothetical protein
LKGHSYKIELTLAHGRHAEDGAAALEARPLEVVGTQDGGRVVAVTSHLRSLKTSQARPKGQGFSGSWKLKLESKKLLIVSF